MSVRSVSPPVPTTSHLTSGFGMRLGQTTRRPTFHAGIDFLAPAGTPVYAVADGRIGYVGRDADGQRSRTWGYGNCIGLAHDSGGFWSLYAHLSQVLVDEGEHVEAGRLLGYSGRTSGGKFPRMGAHFHLEIRRVPADGHAPIPGPYRTYNVDPEAWLRERGVEVRGSVGFRGLAACPHCEGLGQFEEIDYSGEGAPDAPVRDLDTYEYSPWLLVGGTALAAGSAVASAFIVTQAYRGWRG